LLICHFNKYSYDDSIIMAANCDEQMDVRESKSEDYYMAFFISYPLSALGLDISPRNDRLGG
jgi:hypothetical protein